MKREKLLHKFVLKKQKNNLYKLQLPFSIWHKKTILSKANENATIIQDKFRSYITRKHTRETLAKKQLQKIFRFNQLKNLLSKIKDEKSKDADEMEFVEFLNNYKTVKEEIIKTTINNKYFFIPSFSLRLLIPQR